MRPYMFGQPSLHDSSFVFCSLRWIRDQRQKSGFTVNHAGSRVPPLVAYGCASIGRFEMPQWVRIGGKNLGGLPIGG
jgi:hypothetical protein